jgi:hypothetical protein
MLCSAGMRSGSFEASTACHFGDIFWECHPLITGTKHWNGVTLQDVWPEAKTALAWTRMVSSCDDVAIMPPQTLAGLEHLELQGNALGRLDDVNSLRKYNSSLVALELQGNPLAEDKTYRDLVLRRLPHLTRLDGLPVRPTLQLPCHCPSYNGTCTGESVSLHRALGTWNERSTQVIGCLLTYCAPILARCVCLSLLACEVGGSAAEQQCCRALQVTAEARARSMDASGSLSLSMVTSNAVLRGQGLAGGGAQL